MKRPITYCILLAAILTTASCKKFLEERSPDKIPLEKAITNEETATQFLYGAYGCVKNTIYGIDYMMVTEVLTDDVDYTGSASNARALAYMNFDNKNTHIKNIWTELYAVVEQSNILIDALEQNPSLSPGYGTRLIAEAKTLRAWAYMNIVQLWGEAPLVTVPVYSIKDNLFPARSSVNDIYAQIIGDLNYAVDNMSPDKTYVTSAKNATTVKYSYPLAFTKAAPVLLLGKVYALCGQWQEVVSALSYFATEAGFNPAYGLVSQYNKLFDTRYKTDPERSSEVFWEIESKADPNYYNSIQSNVAPSGRVDPWGNVIDAVMPTRYQNIIPTYNLLRSFSPNDLRYRQSFRFIGRAPDSTPQMLKNYDIQALDSDIGGPTVVLLRLADAYLLLAEAYNELGSPALADFFSEPVRARAALGSIGTLSQADMRQALRDERRREFACEQGYRLFDLRRWGVYKSVMTAFGNGYVGSSTTETFVDMVTGNTTPAIRLPFSGVHKTWQDKYVLHPIPYTEMIANPNLTTTIPNWN